MKILYFWKPVVVIRKCWLKKEMMSVLIGDIFIWLPIKRILNMLLAVAGSCVKVLLKANSLLPERTDMTVWRWYVLWAKRKFRKGIYWLVMMIFIQFSILVRIFVLTGTGVETRRLFPNFIKQNGSMTYWWPKRLLSIINLWEKPPKPVAASMRNSVHWPIDRLLLPINW